ncbi:MAG: acyltransferase [Gloeobacteraceae cyanobacterium ES-bin-144]|nr:acyltransferase [Verrucomicrobiales bacterium]
MAATRNTQLDGWRAIAVVGVMCVHWVPSAWRGAFPFEIGLFYFLTLTGFLITRILLRERDAREADGGAWRWNAYRGFQKRRMARILVPCYAAMVFALIVGASDIRNHPLAYFGHYSNFHMAWMEGWPSGTAHYWTLAIQVQFYLLWPLVVFLTPLRSLAWMFGCCVALAPMSRFLLEQWFPEIQHVQAITSASLDYFGVGALLALALERGMKPGDRRLAVAAWLAFAGYAVLYTMRELGHPLLGPSFFQQTLLSLAFAGLISATLVGFHGWRGWLLDHPAAQHLGRLSFGLYLFHTPVPLLIGLMLPWLWHPMFNGPLLLVRLAVYALVSWGMAWLCWRWLEGPGRLRVPWLAADETK